MGNVQKVCRKDESHSQLHFAAKLGNTEAVRSLLMSSSNVEELDTEHNTPLHYASQNGHVDIVNILLSKNPSDGLRNAFGQTSIHRAAKYRRAGIVKKLKYNGANVNACNNAKMTPLHLACRYGHISIVEILLDTHATVDISTQSDETPFYLAAKNGHADVTDLLLRRGVCEFVLPGHYKETPLHVAVKGGHTEVVEVILKHSSRISGKLINCRNRLQANVDNSIKTSGIHSIKLVKPDSRRLSAGIVWSEENMPLEIWEDEFGYIALDLAVKLVQPKMVKLLLSADQGMYSRGHLGNAFVCLLIQSRIYNMIKDCGNNSEDLTDDEQYVMFSENIKEIAQALISSTKFNVNHVNAFGESPIFDVINDIGCVHNVPGKKIPMICIIQLLLEQGADFNLMNSKGETPLMLASKIGCCDVVQILFDWEQKSGTKLDLNARDRYGETALMKAVASNDKCHAFKIRDAWTYKPEIKLDIDARATVLIKAVEMNHVAVIRLLLGHKASVNLCDYYGFTALHAAVFERKTNWFDLQFFWKDLRKQNIDGASSSLETSSREQLQLGGEIMDPHRLINWLQCHIDFIEGTILSRGDALRKEIGFSHIVFHRLLSNLRLRLEAVKLLLDNDEINVNAKDFRGYTPLDLAMESLKDINGTSLNAPKNSDAIREFHETPLEAARVDDRGRNPLHRLMISLISDCLFEYPPDKQQDDREQFDLMVEGILLNPENVRESATATDNKGRTPLHYAAISSSFPNLHKYSDTFEMLLDIGSKIDSADIYGKTPLHYSENNLQNKILAKYGADKTTNDSFGNKPKDLNVLRDLVNTNENNAYDTPDMNLYSPVNIAQVLNTNHVTELTRRKVVETICIYSQSPRPRESAKKAVWRIWNKNKFIRLNRRLSQLKPSVKHFVERLSDGINKIDWRFECQPILVGSSEEETKAVISGDFDFNFRLIKFSQFCNPFPHPLGPKGYFELRRKANEDTESRGDETFDIFFNLDHCLLTDEVNSRFKIILEEVLSDPDFWQSEHQFDWDIKHKHSSRYGKLDGLCTNIRLRLLNPIDDGEGGFLFVKISIDITAVVRVEDWWPEDPLPIGISLKTAVKADGCTFVFHRPNFHLWKPSGTHFTFPKSYARISFAPLECRIIKESSPLIKGAYMVCKMILNLHSRTTYQLKTCLLFCMEAFNSRSGNETGVEYKITPKKLAVWVERIMFCFTEFSLYEVFPCYFMPSFRQEVKHLRNGHIIYLYVDEKIKKDKILFSYCGSYDLYLDICPDDTAIDIPAEQGIHLNRIRTRYPNNDPLWERFEREEFTRSLSSRRSH